MTTRVCRVCQQDKPIEAFAVYNREGGRRRECHACMTERRKKYLDGEWISKARVYVKVVNLRILYSGPGHCWVCRRSVKSPDPFALCHACQNIDWKP